MRGIDDDQIDTVLDQRLGALLGIGADTDRGARPAGGPASSLVAFGNWIFFWMSLTVIRPVR